MPYPLQMILMPGVGALDHLPRVRLHLKSHPIFGGVLNPAQLRHLAALLCDAAEKATDVAVEIFNERHPE
jgi:hypothetical protein